jgi:Tfp pilus assembly protein FimT
MAGVAGKCLMSVGRANWKERGFSLAELTLILAVGTIITATSVPIFTTSMRSMRLAGDARNICDVLTQARLESTAQMTRYKLVFSTSNSSWHLEKLNQATGTFAAEGSTNYLYDGLSNCGISFQSQSTSAPSGFPTTSSASIMFNSRGIPIDNNGTPTANNIIYLNYSNKDYAITVSLTGKVQLWQKLGGTWVSE